MARPNPASQVNCYLVGFMGTGKSTVGRHLAKRMGMQFIDSDHEIEKRAGATIGEIFDRLGEVAFRRMEREFIESGHPPQRCVVSCGGGMVTQDGMIELLSERGVVICLTATPETIFRRTQTHSTRPLLNVDDPLDRIREMLSKRDPVYRRAGTQVLTDFRPMHEIVGHVQRVFLREAREFLARKAKA